MRQLIHPFTKHIYEWADDGIGPVLVCTRDGITGRFDGFGRWVSGELRNADPEMCRWIAVTGPVRNWFHKPGEKA